MPMNWIDRAVAAVAPTAGLRRARTRLQIERLRAFEAGRMSSRDRMRRASENGPNLEVGPVLVRLRAHARRLVRDNPYAKKITNTLVAHQVGYGIQPRSNSGDRALDKQVDALWKRWAKRAGVSGIEDVYAIQALAARTRSVSGEALIRFVKPSAARMQELRLPVPLQLEVLEPDMLADQLDPAGLPLSPRVVQGVEFDGENRRVAYWLRLSHPGETQGLRDTAERARRWPISDVVHLFRTHVERPGQVRGVPDLTAVILRTGRLEDLEEATLELARAQSMLGIVFETETPADFTPEGTGAAAPQGQEPGSEVAGIEMYPGMVVNGPPGSKPHFLTPSGPGGFAPFAEHQLHAIAAGSDVTYDQATGNLSGANFSSLRSGKVEFKRVVEQDQWLMLVPRMCDPIWDAFIDAAVLCGALGFRPEGYPVEWMPPAMEMVDPIRELPGKRLMRRMGLQTWRQQVLEQGENPTEQAEALEAENKDFDARGLVLDGDPRRTNGAGGAQDSGQNARVELDAKGGPATRRPIGDDPAALAGLMAEAARDGALEALAIHAATTGD